MITLVKEFAKRTYKHYHIDTKVGMYDLEYLDSPLNSSASGSRAIRNSSKATTRASMQISGATVTESRILSTISKKHS